MAQMVLTVAGTVAGTAIGGPLGGAIGAAIGSAVGGYIDQTLLFPTRLEGPRLTDLKVTVSTYGTAIPLIYGPENRLTGNVIWSTGLVEHSSTSGGKGGPTVTSYSYTTSVAILLGEGVMGPLKRVWANSKLIFDASVATSTPIPGFGGLVNWTSVHQASIVFSSLTYYPGATDQDIDPTMEASLGVGNVPAYNNSAYVVIKDLQLADFGNALPNLEFEIEGQLGTSVASWVRDISDRAGVSGLDISTIQVNGDGKGYIISHQMSAADAITPLGLAFNFDPAEQSGHIRCIKRGNGIYATIPVEDMATTQANNPPAEPLRIETLSPLSMPREVTITYSDKDLDYQTNSQRATRQLGNSANNISHELPMTIAATDARKLADLAMWDGWAARRTAKFSLSDKWHHLGTAQVVGIPLGNDIAPFKIVRSTRGANGVTEYETRMADPEAYNSNAIGIAGILPANVLKLPGATRLVCMDCPIVRDADDDSGFYWAVSAESNGWRGAEIDRSADLGANYVEMSRVAVRAVMGDVAAALPTGPVDYFDRANVITVVLYYSADELESVDETAVLNGANAFWLGNADGENGEIIQFTTATLIAPLTYELSGLLRGRRGTDFAIDGHGADEVFVLLQKEALGRSDFGAGDWDKDRLYKPVSILLDLASTASQNFTNGGEGKKPFSPVNISGARDVSNNLSITWNRRSRLSGTGLFGGYTPLGEEAESYEVDIIVASVVVRTLTASIQSVVYSAADQTSDGITPGDPVEVEVFQISSTRGRGHGRSRTI